jgi:hypothetical protein
MTRSAAERALAQVRKKQEMARIRVINNEIAKYQLLAQKALDEVIKPWWEIFKKSDEAAHLGVRMKTESEFYPQLADDIRFLRENQEVWHARILLMGHTRRFRFKVKQLPKGEGPRSWAGAMLIHGMERKFSFESVSLTTVNLHPIVFVDFAEQIEAKIVKARVQAYIDHRL